MVNKQPELEDEFIFKQADIYQATYGGVPKFVTLYADRIESKANLKLIKDAYEFYTLESYTNYLEDDIVQIKSKKRCDTLYQFISTWFKDMCIIILDYRRYKKDRKIEFAGLASFSMNLQYVENSDAIENKDYEYIKNCIINKEIINQNLLMEVLKTLRVFQLSLHMLDTIKPDLVINLNVSYIGNIKDMKKYKLTRIDYSLILDNLTTFTSAITKKDEIINNYTIIPFRAEDAMDCDESTIKFFMKARQDSNKIAYRNKPNILQYTINPMMVTRQDIAYRLLDKNYQLYVTYNNRKLEEAISMIEYSFSEDRSKVQLHNLYIKENYKTSWHWDWLLTNFIRNIGVICDTGTIIHYKWYDVDVPNDLSKYGFIPTTYTFKITASNEQKSIIDRLFS